MPSQSSGDPRVGVKAGGGDDAVHFAGEADGVTVCGLPAVERNIAVEAGDVDCWTCQRWGRGDRKPSDG